MMGTVQSNIGMDILNSGTYTSYSNRMESSRVSQISTQSNAVTSVENGTANPLIFINATSYKGFYPHFFEIFSNIAKSQDNKYRTIPLREIVIGLSATIKHSKFNSEEIIGHLIASLPEYAIRYYSVLFLFHVYTKCKQSLYIDYENLLSEVKDFLIGLVDRNNVQFPNSLVEQEKAHIINNYQFYVNNLKEIFTLSPGVTSFLQKCAQSIPHKHNILIKEITKYYSAIRDFIEARDYSQLIGFANNNNLPYLFIYLYIFEGAIISGKSVYTGVILGENASTTSVRCDPGANTRCRYETSNSILGSLAYQLRSFSKYDAHGFHFNHTYDSQDVAIRFIDLYARM